VKGLGRLGRSFLMAALATVLLPVTGAQATPALNPTFGVEGIARSTFPTPSPRWETAGLGTLLLAAGPSEAQAVFARGRLARFVDGRLDRAFGEAGFVGLPQPEGLTLAPVALSIDEDGRLVVFGTATDEAAPYAIFNAYMQAGVKPSLAFVARFLPNGQLDGSFGGGDGIVLSDFGLPMEGQRATAGASDGYVDADGIFYLVVGANETRPCHLCHTSIGFLPHLLVELSPDGRVVTTSKYEEPDFDPRLPGLPESAEQVVRDPRGRIVVLGEPVYRHNRDIGRRIWRYRADGTLDKSFRGGSSLLRMRPGTDNPRLNYGTNPDLQVVPASDGIFLVGTFQRPKKPGPPNRRERPIRGLMVMRLRDDGGLSRRFGKDGVSVTRFGPRRSTYFKRSAVLAPQGRLLVAGETIHSGRADGKPVELVLVELKATP
jgi:hypothetical protein